MPKNIVIFSDGTGREGGKGHSTNVYKVFNIVLDRSPQQIAFYDSGLGTGWRKFTGLAGGRGFGRNLREGYEFIFDNYQAGDRIFLFGFSRGAATVRSLSAFLHMFGILPKSRRDLIGEAYKIYKDGDADKRKRRAAEFVARHRTMWTTVTFVGVWDTVAALGLPIKGLDAVINWLPFWKHRFHNYELSRCVEHAYHALAIDDERKTYHPVLWDRLPDAREEDDARTVMQQVWFAGMHSDIGGGYAEAALSDIALEWMVQRAVEHGLRIYHAEPATCRPDPNGVMHDARQGLHRLFPRKVRTWDKGYGPTVHESVTLRTANRSNEDAPPYAPWILAQPDYEIEPWVHWDKWFVRPPELEAWLAPVDPRLSPAARRPNPTAT